MKRELKSVNGILLLNKPLHLTSNGALQRVKRLFAAKKAGHTGSLDPLATGMLPLCFGEATKVSQFLLDSNKHYRVEVKLGVKTTTGDAEGEIIQILPVPANLSREKLTEVLNRFTGLIEQVPPMFSALKVNGKPLYELARKGIEVERKSRTVNIYSINLLELKGDTFSMDVHCSKGTYIRTLAEDIGDALGCGAYVTGLHRTAVEPYQQDTMFTLEQLEQVIEQQGTEALQQFLLPIDTSLQHLPIAKLSSSSTFYIRTGQAVMVPGLPREGFVRIFSDDSRFLGIGEILEDGRLAPRRLVNISQYSKAG